MGKIRGAERRHTEIEDELLALEAQVVGEADVVAALADFDAVWACLAPKDQVRVVELLVDRVVYDADEGSVAISFRPAGFNSLAAELAEQKEEAA